MKGYDLFSALRWRRGLSEANKEEGLPTTGTLADVFRQDLSVSIVISLAFTGRQKVSACLPIGWYFALRRTAGSSITVVSAFDQAVG